MRATIPTISENRIRRFAPGLYSDDYLISTRRSDRREVRSRSDKVDRWSLLVAKAIGKQVLAPWIELIREQLIAISELKSGWDSHGSAAPGLEVIQGALNLAESLHETGLVPKPHIYPTRSGGVQFEWEVGEKYLEIELLSQTQAVYFYSDLRDRYEAEGELREGESLDDVIELIDSMYQ
jgi:hypothetical protein